MERSVRGTISRGIDKRVNSIPVGESRYNMFHIPAYQGEQGAGKCSAPPRRVRLTKQEEAWQGNSPVDEIMGRKGRRAATVKLTQV